MSDIDDIVFNEQWDRVLKEISKNKKHIGRLEPCDLAWKRFQYQLANNGKEELIAPFGNFTDLLKIIDKFKEEGMVGLTIPQATAFQQLDQVKKLIKQGHNIDEQDFGERTGLLVAAALNDEQFVQFFIDNGAFVSFYDQDNFEAIDLTTSKEIVELLAGHGGKTKEQRRQEYDEYCDAREKLNILREINLSFMKSTEKFQITDKDTFPHIMIRDIQQLAVPNELNIETKKIETLVDQILAKKSQDNSADTSDLEKQIDQMVYQLYELTEEEIKIVERK